MTDFDAIKWIVGLLVGFALAVVAGFRNMRNNISGHHKDIYSRLDEVKRDYVRRDDFKAHMDRQDAVAARIERQVDKISDKIDKIIK